MKFHNPRLTSTSDEKHVYVPENLVFSGGGIKGIAYSGTITALEEKGLLSGIKGYAGASAGAITAALLAIGMNSQDISYEMNNVEFKTFLQKSNINIEKLVNNPRGLLDPLIGAKFIFDEVEYRGLCDASVFTNWLVKLFKKKGFDEHTTFQNLFMNNRKNLKIILCNANYGKTVIADHINTPDMPVVTAVRGSMSIPFVFRPLLWNGDMYIDGGTMYNYPIEVFDASCLPEKTLGFMLSTPSKILNPTRKNDDNIIQHLECFFSAVMNVSYEYCFRLGNQYRTVFVDPGEIGTLDFDLNAEQKQQLFENGYNSTMEYINKSLPQ